MPGPLVVAGPDDLPEAPAPEPVRWPPGAATGVGSLPGTDPAEAAATVVGELPLLPHLPELPARGVGADMIGRTAALLVDLAVEVVPTGWRVTARPGRDHRRAVDLLHFDVDALDAACAGPRPEWVKVQAAGPWTLAASVELHTGHRVLTDRGAVREFAASWARGCARTSRRSRSGPARACSSSSTSRACPRCSRARCRRRRAGGRCGPCRPPTPRTCCATSSPASVRRWWCTAARADPPVRLLAATGVAGIGIDATLPAVQRRDRASRRRWTRWARSGTRGSRCCSGWSRRCRRGGRARRRTRPRDRPTPGADRPVPTPARTTPVAAALRSLARRAFDLADRLGFDRARLGELAVPTPTCGLAGATPAWARRAMTLCRELGQAFVDPPETW